MTLYLLPNLLHETADPKASIVPVIHEVIYRLDGFFVETPKVARQYLKHFDFERLRDKPMESIAKNVELTLEMIDPLVRGENWGVISDAGLPCIADPGARVVSLARRAGVKIVAYPGPCSITHALSLSGFDGNGFTFHGYFPKKPSPLPLGIHIFIETPYNNISTIEALLGQLKPRDILCVASDLMGENEEVVVQKISEWKSDSNLKRFHKRPSIIILQIR